MLGKAGARAAEQNKERANKTQVTSGKVHFSIGNNLWWGCNHLPRCKRGFFEFETNRHTSPEEVYSSPVFLPNEARAAYQTTRAFKHFDYFIPCLFRMQT
jgi:hypothetical protein